MTSLEALALIARDRDAHVRIYAETVAGEHSDQGGVVFTVTMRIADRTHRAVGFSLLAAANELYTTRPWEQQSEPKGAHR